MKQRKQTKNLRITTRVIAVLITIAMIMGNAFYGGGTEVSEVSAATEEDTSYINYEEVYTLYHTCTIKQKNGKWYYVNSKGKINKKKGWKKDQSGKLTYYVGKNGYVKYKIEGYTLYKWNGKKFKTVSVSKNKCGLKKVAGKYFYVDSEGLIDRGSGWIYEVSLPKYRVTKSGYVDVKCSINSTSAYKWKNGKWKKISRKKLNIPVSGHYLYKNDMETIVNETIFYINEERLGAGLWRLVVLDEYLDAAQIRADELTWDYSHTEHSVYYKGTDICVNENIGYIGTIFPKVMVNGMMVDESDPSTRGHRGTIENRTMTGIGVAYSKGSDGTWYCNMLFFTNSDLQIDILEEEAEKRGVDVDVVVLEMIKDTKAYYKKRNYPDPE